MTTPEEADPPSGVTDTGVHMSASPRVIDQLQGIGLNLFGTASNVIFDYGRSGLLNTIEELESRNVSFAGIGRNLVEARQPAYLTRLLGGLHYLAYQRNFLLEPKQANKQK